MLIKFLIIPGWCLSISPIVTSDKVPLINLPSELLHIGFKPNHKNTVIMCFDNGWQFSFRVHNAEKHVTPSLKFDIQIEGMPIDIKINFDCTWKNENN